MTTDPESLECDYCGASPTRPCTTEATRARTTRPHKARRVDAYRKDLRAEARRAPEGSDLHDAYLEVMSRMDNGIVRVSAFLEAVKWMQERNR